MICGLKMGKIMPMQAKEVYYQILMRLQTMENFTHANYSTVPTSLLD